MSINTLIYGFILFTCDQVLVKASAMSSPIRDDAASLLLYNPSVYDIEPFEYAGGKHESTDSPRESLDSSELGRRSEHKRGSHYVRFGRSQEQINGYNDEAGEKTARGSIVVRLGRSSLKVPHQKINRLVRSFVRLGKSGGSEWVRLGRSAANSAVPSEAELALLCPNILVDEDARGSKDLQLYLARLMYICNNYSNGLNAERNDDNSHQNNLEFVEANGDTV